VTIGKDRNSLGLYRLTTPFHTFFLLDTLALLLLHLCTTTTQTKFSTRAFKLTLPEIKKLCDLFVVDRTKKNNKDDLIDALLDFLGAPSAELLKGSHNKSSSKGSKGKAGGSSKKEEEADEESDDEVESEEEDVAEDALQKDGLPTDKALRKWVRAYVSSFNLKKVTLKHAIATASDKFGVDLTPKKSLLKTILKNEM